MWVLIITFLYVPNQPMVTNGGSFNTEISCTSTGKEVTKAFTESGLRAEFVCEKK